MHMVENFHELVSYSALQYISVGNSPATPAFFFYCGVGNISIYYIIFILFFRSESDLGFRQHKSLPRTNIFSL